MEVVNAHIEELKDNSKGIEKAYLKNILDGNDYTHRKLNSACDSMIQTLECLKTVITNIKSKNIQEWTATRRQS
jgi:hypothetical protein